MAELDTGLRLLLLYIYNRPIGGGQEWTEFEYKACPNPGVRIHSSGNKRSRLDPSYNMASSCRALEHESISFGCDRWMITISPCVSEYRS